MRCEQQRERCAYITTEGACLILADTHFEKHGEIYKCPFCKEIEKVDRCDYYFENYQGRFRRVLGYGNKYYISDTGIVLSPRKEALKAKLNNKGRLIVKLNHGGYSSSVYVSSLVVNTFTTWNSSSIVFLDGDPTNCSLDNLRPKETDDGNATED